MTHPAWSNRKLCASCGKDMSADDAHKKCQSCRPTVDPAHKRAYFLEWQKRDRQQNGRRV